MYLKLHTLCDGGQAYLHINYLWKNARNLWIAKRLITETNKNKKNKKKRSEKCHNFIKRKFPVNQNLQKHM